MLFDAAETLPKVVFDFGKSSSYINDHGPKWKWTELVRSDYQFRLIGDNEHFS